MQNNNIPVFLASDNNYAPFVATTIASICYHTKSFIDFYVLDSGISKINKLKIENLKNKFNNFSVEFIFIDLEKYFEGYVDTDVISKDTYSRYLIPLLKPELNKVVYSDIDVIFLGDIKEMYDIDLKNTFIGGCPRYFTPDDKHLKNDLDMTDEELKGYAFQAGNLLINSKKWREENITEQCFNVHKIYKKKLFGTDQDVLFKVCKNNFTQLHSKFCATTLIYDQFFKNKTIYNLDLILRNSDKEEDILKELKEAITNPVIRHYETKNKPWLTDISLYSGKRMIFFNEFWDFAKMTDFYDNILINFILSIKQDKNNVLNKKYKLKLFNFIPLLKIQEKDKTIEVKLFNFIPIFKINKK